MLINPVFMAYFAYFSPFCFFSLAQDKYSSALPRYLSRKQPDIQRRHLTFTARHGPGLSSPIAKPQLPAPKISGFTLKANKTE